MEVVQGQEMDEGPLSVEKLRNQRYADQTRLLWPDVLGGPLQIEHLSLT